MPRIFLSPSTQEYNPYITGNGSEEYFMNQIADAMEPYLLANTIRFTRNTPDMTAASSIRLANSGSSIFIWRFTPTAAPMVLRRAPSAVSSLFIIPAVLMAAARRIFL